MANEFWFKFRFKDWANDVKPLSLTAKGLLIELIIHLRKNGGTMPVDVKMIARLTGGLTEEITEALTEFRTHGIFDFAAGDDGKEVLQSRGILRELRKSLVNKENGQKGGNPKLKKRGIRLTDSDNRTHNRTSVSISYSNSDSNSENDSQKKGGAGGKKFVPPELNEVEIFFQSEGYPRELGEHVWRYYAEADPPWTDAKGNKVRSWKSKMRGVWMKPENKNWNGTGKTVRVDKATSRESRDAYTGTDAGNGGLGSFKT